MITVTNNRGVLTEVGSKEIEIIGIVYENGLYSMQKGDYEEAENYLIDNGLVLWEIFSGKLIPIPNLEPIIELFTNWQETDSDIDPLNILFKDFIKNEKT